jgi:hypothetical protein
VRAQNVIEVVARDPKLPIKATQKILQYLQVRSASTCLLLTLLYVSSAATINVQHFWGIDWLACVLLYY